VVNFYEKKTLVAPQEGNSELVQVSTFFLLVKLNQLVYGLQKSLEHFKNFCWG
jgi:hypothetical protein